MKDVGDRKKIKAIYFVSECGESISANPNTEIVLLNEYHGEYDIDWASVREIKSKKEIGRWNIKYLQGLEWEFEPEVKG